MTIPDPVVSALHESMRCFLQLVSGVRPDLHRYCARMTGSVADGEDIVQDTLARAYYALSEMESVPELRPWLFQIAHNRALDHLRRYERRMSEPLDSVAESALSTPVMPKPRHIKRVSVVMLALHTNHATSALQAANDGILPSTSFLL